MKLNYKFKFKMIKIENEEDNPQFIFLEKIKAMLIIIIEKERITNSIKISLSNSQNLNIINYFNEIDSNEKNYIDINDIKKYLKQNSISYDEYIIRKFIHLFDKHNKFHLIYEDFSKIFVPYNVNDNYNNYNIMTEKEMIINIIEGYLELAEQINEMIINIRNTNNFTTYEAFMGITKGNKYLDEEFLSHFLEHNYKCEEIKNLIYLIDINNDSLISYDEFQDFFIPLLKYNEGIELNKYIETYKNKINIENNDIVNFEKSGKFMNNNINNDYFNQSNNDNMENKIDNNNKYELNENNVLNENNNNIEEKEENKIDNNNNNENNEEDNEEQINNMENSNESINNQNNSEINDNNINNNKLNSSQKENENNNNNYEMNISNDDEYDNYCNFYRKTRQIITSSSEKNKINPKDNEEKINDTNKSIDNINDTNKNTENNQNKELNIIHSEIQYIKNNKKDTNSKEFTIVKNGDITLSEKNKNSINNFNTAEKESNLTNINNFTCGKNTKNSLGNSSSKKINLNINSNDLENYSLSNEYNKINNNLISKDTIINIKSDENILSASNENKNDIIKNPHINNNSNISNNINKIINSDNEILNKEKEINKQEQNENQEKIITNISQLNFIKYIQYILEKEKYTLDLKDKLSLREDVSLKDIFYIFDYNKKNKISKKEFKVVCKKIFGLYPTSDQINLVYKRYDNDKDDELNLKDFFNLIKPLKEEYACFLFNKKKNEGNINMKSKKMLNDVIRAIIEDEGYYYKFKDDLDNQNLFDLKYFWKTIEKYINKEGIDKLDTNKFLNDFGCNLSQYDIDIIFNKIDHDKDDIISYNDLNQEFLDYY